MQPTRRQLLDRVFRRSETRVSLQMPNANVNVARFVVNVTTPDEEFICFIPNLVSQLKLSLLMKKM